MLTKMKFMVTLIGFILLYYSLCQKIDKSQTHEIVESYMKNQTDIEKPDAKNYSKTKSMDKLTTSFFKMHNDPQIKAKATVKRTQTSNNATIKEKYIDGIDNKSSNGINILFGIKADIIQQGCRKLNSLADSIKNEINIKYDISADINKVTDDYITELDTYFKLINKKRELRSEIDWDYYFLHIVESCHKIFSSKTKLLYESIMTPVSIEKYVDVDFIGLRDLIQETVDDEKKDNLRYICEMFDVCRYYPAYSDNFSELLTQILDLHDDDLVNVITMFKNVVKEHLIFLEKIMCEEIVTRISNAFTSINEVSKLREFVSLLRNMISQRYILVVSKDKKVNERMKAVKILIDIVDKTFEKVGNDYHEYKLYNLLKGFPVWDMKKSVEIAKALESHFIELFDVLNMNLFPNTEEEIKELIYFIITGSSENTKLIKQLLAKGAKFIREDSMFSPISGLALALF